MNWFPCKQVLPDKADSAYIFLTTDRSLKAGSNGLLENTVELSGNRIRYEWKTRYPIAYYLISYAVADYYDYSYYVKLPGREDSLLVQNYIYDTLAYLEQNKSDIDNTGNMISLFSGLVRHLSVCFREIRALRGAARRGYGTPDHDDTGKL